MTDLLKKFSAAETVKSNNHPVRVCVYGAYREHLKDINPMICLKTFRSSMNPSETD
jgi:hypothetical protein